MSGTILLLLGFVFALAGVAKLASPDQFRATLRKLIPKKLAIASAVAIPWMELILAAWLVSGVAPRAAAVASILVLLVFSSALLHMWRKGLKCGCFGEAADSAPSGLARNVLLIALAAWVALPDHAIESPWSMGFATVVGRVTVVLGAACLWPCLVALAQRRNMIFGNPRGV